MEEGVEIDFNLRELPRLTGVGEPGIRTMLDRMERSGLVEKSGDRLMVRDPARLADYLSYLELRWKFGDP
jgi:DNA-binding MarR family transcriptional regulator